MKKLILTGIITLTAGIAAADGGKSYYLYVFKSGQDPYMSAEFKGSKYGWNNENNCESFADLANDTWGEWGYYACFDHRLSPEQ